MVILLLLCVLMYCMVMCCVLVFYYFLIVGLCVCRISDFNFFWFFDGFLVLYSLSLLSTDFLCGSFFLVRCCVLS